MRGSVVGSAFQAGLSLRARCPWVLPACLADPACGCGPRRSTTRPGGNSLRKQACGAQSARRYSACGRCAAGSTSRPGGTHRPIAGHGVRPAGPGDSASMHGVCGFDQTARRTEPPSTVLQKPARRDSASGRGAPQPAQRDSASGRGPWSRPAARAGLSLWVRGSVVGSAVQAGLSHRSWAAAFDQPARRDSASLHGVRGFYQPARRTQPAGAVHGGRPAGPAGLGLWARGNTSLPGRTQPRGTCRRYRAARTAGLSLRALGSVVGSAVQAGLSHRSGAAGVDQPALRDLAYGRGAPQPAQRDSASGCGAARLDQACRRDSASLHGVREFDQSARRTEPPSTVLHKPGRGTVPPDAGRVG